MKSLIAFAIATSVSAAAFALPQTFGEKPKLTNDDAVPVAKVLADPQAYAEKLVRVRGDVSEVCASKGCWLTLGDDAGHELFVKFNCPIEGRLIPADAAGKPVQVEGKLKITQITEAEARHLAEDRQATPEEIAAINGPQTQVQLVGPTAILGH